MKATAAIEILLVEDNPADVRLAREALREGSVATHLTSVEDGVEALAFLRREGKYGDAPRPDIILLDLNMPRKGGLEVLSEVKSDPALRPIPVVVLTTSSDPDDVFQAYDLQASAFITKPADLDEFVNTMQCFDEFCLTVVKLPPRQ